MIMFYHPKHLREQKSFFTNDLGLVSDYLNKGWTYRRINSGFIVRSPEEWLVDLTDPYKILSCKDPYENLAIFVCTKYLIKKKLFDNVKKNILNKYGLNNFDCYLFDGETLETEIRIGGNDSRIKDFKKYYILELKKTDLWEKVYKDTHNFLGKIRKINIFKTSFKDKDVFCQKFYYETKEIYSSIGYKIPSYCNINFYKGIFDGIPKHYDIYVFVPSGCFKYMYDFINKENINKISLYNYHADVEDTHKNIYNKKNLKNKKILIMDTSYSGATLNNLKEMLEKEGGIVTKLALFPKSKLAIKNSDYSLIFNKFIKSDCINTNQNDRHLEMYKKIFSEHFKIDKFRIIKTNKIKNKVLINNFIF